MIVRNVGFNVKVEQIRERFQDLGELVEIILPPSKRTDQTTADGKKMRIPPHAGYAFVEFDTRAQAQAALTAVNGSRIGGRAVAVDFAYDIRLFKAIKNKSAHETTTSTEPPVAAEKAAPTEEATPVAAAVTTAVQSLKQKERPAPTNNKNAKKPKLEDENDRKVFLINVPFDADRSDIETGICEFANLAPSTIQTVLIVKDKATGKPSGKAFVIFNDSASASTVLALEKSSIPQLFGDLYKNTKAATAPIEGAGCVVLGRRVAIMAPLSKEEISKQKEIKEEENNPKNPKVVNRKHIDFINAGWMNEKQPEWHDLTMREQKLRMASNDEKKFKLSNSNFVINTKRLTIRNVPKRMENGDLQHAIVKAMGVKGSKKTKQCGIIKVAIVKDKLMVPVGGGDKDPKEAHFDMNEDSSDDEAAKKGEANADIKMKQKKRSRGFAFVDFADSERAMKCLESMNNVAGAFGQFDLTRRPIVEFSFDDVRKLQIQQNRAVNLHAKAKEAEKAGVPAVAVKKGIKKEVIGRGKKQRMKKAAKRAAAEAAAAATQ